MFLIIHLNDPEPGSAPQFITHFKSLDPVRGWDTAAEAISWAKAKWPDGGYALVMLMKQPDSK